MWPPKIAGELPKRVAYKGGFVVDDHYTPLGPRRDFARSRKYIQETLLPIYERPDLLPDRI